MLRGVSVLLVGLVLAACLPPLEDHGDTDQHDEETSQKSYDLDADGFDNDVDCNDIDPAINPGADEVCNGIDDDCDELIDESDAVDATIWYADLDGDGYGDSAIVMVSCFQPDGYVDEAADCDDTDFSIYPDADEFCDGIDNNCNGTVDEDDALDVAIWYADGDLDGYGDAAVTDVDCYQPSGFVAIDSDCDDTDAAINPDAIEICDGVDNDCDDFVDDLDDNLIDGIAWYIDDDSDGFGDVSSSVYLCEQPEGFVDDATDCDDADFTVNTDAVEFCDGVDNNCSGNIDDDDACQCADDLSEGLPWLCADGNLLGLQYMGGSGYWVDDGSGSWDGIAPDPTLVAVTGTGVDNSWSYIVANLTEYDADYGWMYYEFAIGMYRVNWCSENAFALNDSWCSSSSYTSSLCYQNTDGTWSVCFQSDGYTISALSTEDCASLE